MINENINTFVNRLLLEDESKYLATLNKFYKQKYNKEYPEKDAPEEKLRKDLIDIASEFESNIRGSNQKMKADIAIKVIDRELPNIKPEVQKPESKQTQEEEKAEDITLKKFPKYEEFRKKWYLSTVELGWPKSIKNPDLKDSNVEKGVELPWNKLTKSAYPFSNKGPGLSNFRNYTKKIKDYLYTKFKNDYPSLKKLAERVEAILDIEKQFLKKKPTNILGQVVMNVFKGIGGTDLDESILKWMSSKANGMSIFEYQKMILDEMLAKMSLGDESPKVLKNILNPLYKTIKEQTSKFYDISVAKPEISYETDDRQYYGAYFNVTVKTGNKDPKTNKIYSPFVTICDTVVRGLLKGDYKSESKRSMTCNIDEDELNDIIDKFEKSVEVKDKGTSSKTKTSADVAREVPDIEFSYDALLEKEVVGKYMIEFSYFTKGCKVLVSYVPKKGVE